MSDTNTIAAKMANVLFNLAQKSGHTLTPDDCILFDKLRKEWDSSRQLSAQSVSAVHPVADAKAVWNRRAPKGNAAQEWLPIESAPENGEYLVYMPQERKKYQVMYAHPNVNLIGNCFAFDMTKPSHWQPLPAAPSNKEVER